MSHLFDIVQWAKENGDERVLARMRVFSLPVLMKEKIHLESIESGRTCSQETLDKIREAAEKVTKKKCPY